MLLIDPKRRRHNTPCGETWGSTRVSRETGGRRKQGTSLSCGFPGEGQARKGKRFGAGQFEHSWLAPGAERLSLVVWYTSPWGN